MLPPTFWSFCYRVSTAVSTPTGCASLTPPGVMSSWFCSVPRSPQTTTSAPLAVESSAGCKPGEDTTTARQSCRFCPCAVQLLAFVKRGQQSHSSRFSWAVFGAAGKEKTWSGRLQLISAGEKDASSAPTVTLSVSVDNWAAARAHPLSSLSLSFSQCLSTCVQCSLSLCEATPSTRTCSQFRVTFNVVAMVPGDRFCIRVPVKWNYTMISKYPDTWACSTSCTNSLWFLQPHALSCSLQLHTALIQHVVDHRNIQLWKSVAALLKCIYSKLILNYWQ